MSTFHDTSCSHHSSRGFGVVEILVVIAVIATVFFAVYQFAIVATGSVHAGAREIEAAYLAQEGIEAVRTVRNRGWADNIAPLTFGATYYPVLSGSSWGLTASDPGLIDGLYTRTVVLGEVVRDGNDNIATTGTVDSDTAKVTSTVTWPEKSGTKEVKLETYITNFEAN